MKVVKGADIASSREGAAEVRVFMTPAGGMANLSITQVTLDPGASTGEHRHDSDQVVYLLDGDGLYAAEGEQYRLTAGDMIYIPAGQLHRHDCIGGLPLRQLAMFVPSRPAGDGSRS